MKRVTILGSTGSIGTNALNIIDRFADRFDVAALAAGSNVRLLAAQIRKFKPKLVAIFDKEAYGPLKAEFPSVDLVAGEEGVREAASYRDTDFVLSSIVGSAGLMPTLEAVKTGKTVGLANKESLVMAGDYFNALAKRHGTKVIPVDSEHNAIFQCISGQDGDAVKSLILTASGGPFIHSDKEEMRNITVDDALNHPNWSMGKKITIDSATLMNKGLEVIEAHHLFGFDASDIRVLIHPQSIVHSMVEFTDGGIIAQMSNPDMGGPIAYAMSYPKRLPGVVSPCLLSRIGDLSFMEPDVEKFPCLGLAYEALRGGGTMPAVLNAANEVSVSAFLEERISFKLIPVIIEEVLSQHRPISGPGLSDILYCDTWAREKAADIIHVRA